MDDSKMTVSGSQDEAATTAYDRMVIHPDLKPGDALPFVMLLEALSTGNVALLPGTMGGKPVVMLCVTKSVDKDAPESLRRLVANLPAHMTSLVSLPVAVLMTPDIDVEPTGGGVQSIGGRPPKRPDAPTGLYL